MGTQIWPCHEKVKGQPMVIIWTNLVDHPWCYIPRFSLKAFLVLEKMIFKYLSMAAILINRLWPFVQMSNPPLTEGYTWSLKKTGLRFQRTSCLKVWMDKGLFVLIMLYITFNNISVISQRCLDVAGSSMLTFRVLPHWNIMPPTLDMIFHPVTLYWYWADQFWFLALLS